MTIVVDEPLLTEGGTVVVLITRLDQATFDRKYGVEIEENDGEIVLDAVAHGIVTFVEFDAPPGVEYRFRTPSGEPVREQQVSVGEGGGYIDSTTGDFAASDVTYHHHIEGTRVDEATSRALLGSFFRIDPASCRVVPAVRVCSGSSEAFDAMLRYFEKSRTP
ncbi:hypothetical protein ACFOEZ_03755 [Tianweitania populi]|uniref:hypothetical protein n=1 Tax=Tianweitania populi TaxID=1607949 RepID=UPI00167B43D5|nr:hypothetical protein [Tianweitania populi]